MKTVAISSVFAVGFAATMLAYGSIGSYMDEIFHIPQAQKYCEGNIDEWDRKITTFPGLYVISASAFGLMSFLSRQLLNIELSCSINFLRSINALLALIFPIVVHLCRLKVEPHAGDSKHLALLAFLYPVNFFYYFLFYTDTASTLSVLVVFYVAETQLEIELGGERKLRKERVSEESPDRNDRSGQLYGAYSLRCLMQQSLLLFTSCASIMMRQTNAVWVLFIAGTMMLTLLGRTTQFRDSTIPSLWVIIEFLQTLLNNLPYLLRVTCPMLVPILAFLVFVVINKGIVIGDKEHHIPVYHLAMPLHACVIYALVMAPSSLLEPAISFISGLINRDLHGPTIQSNDPNASQGGPNNGNSKSQNISYDVINSLQRRDMNRTLSTRRLFKSKKELMFFILKHLTGLIIVTYVLQHYTLSHPFLLADNRHYSFYLWSRILSKPNIRYLLSPFYYYCVQWCLTGFLNSRGFIWTVIFILAVLITLVPAHLLELRYFSPAIVIAMISSPHTHALSIRKLFTRDRNHQVNKNCTEADRKTSRLFNHPYLLLSVCACFVVDVLVVLVFLYRPFNWVDNTVARFMF